MSVVAFSHFLGFSNIDSLPPKAEYTNKILIKTLDLYKGVTVDGLALNIHFAFSELRPEIICALHHRPFAFNPQFTQSATREAVSGCDALSHLRFRYWARACGMMEGHRKTE